MLPNLSHSNNSTSCSDRKRLIVHEFSISCNHIQYISTACRLLQHRSNVRQWWGCHCSLSHRVVATIPQSLLNRFPLPPLLSCSCGPHGGRMDGLKLLIKPFPAQNHPKYLQGKDEIPCHVPRLHLSSVSYSAYCTWSWALRLARRPLRGHLSYCVISPEHSPNSYTS